MLQYIPAISLFNPESVSGLQFHSCTHLLKLRTTKGKNIEIYYCPRKTFYRFLLRNETNRVVFAEDKLFDQLCHTRKLIIQKNYDFKWFELCDFMVLKNRLLFVKSSNFFLYQFNLWIGNFELYLNFLVFS